ncbi:MAG: sensor domain-containing phosphodiesterase [Gammaproteobacteria bacterium]
MDSVKAQPSSSSQPVFASRDVYRSLAEAVSGVTRIELFAQTVRALAFTLDAEYAFVTHRIPGDAKHLNVVAAWHVNRPGQDHGTINLAGTPAADTLLKDELVCPDGVAEQYPLDRWLRAHGIRAYCAVALRGADNSNIGHLGIMCRQPLSADHDLLAALRMLAQRAAAELQRSPDAPASDDEQFLERTAVGFYRMTPDGRLLHANTAFAQLLGYPDLTALMAARPHRDAIFQLDLAERTAMRDQIAHANGYSGQACQILRRDGSRLWVRADLHAVRDSSKGIRFYQGVLQDDSARRRAERLRRQSEVMYQALIDMSPDGIFLSRSGSLAYVSPVLAHLLGYAADELKGLPVDSLFSQQENQLVGSITRGSPGTRASDALEVQLQRKDEREVLTATLRMRRVFWHGRTAILGSVHDTSASKRNERALRRSAYYDELTGLPNRSFFLERLRRRLHAGPPANEQPLAVLFLDMDRFKLINDSLGHSFGDRVLAAITKRLRTCVRPEDVLARYGGDEFAILLGSVQGLDEATAVADRIHEELARAFNVHDRDVFSTASIGIVTGDPQRYQHADELLRDADTAMYRAKAAGKAGYVVFDAAMHAQAKAKLQLETELRHALQRNEFQVYFQPIIELSTGRLTGFESLVRWLHPTRGLLAPEQFLPVAEETGLIIPLGWWVMENACTYLAQWRKRYAFLRDQATTVSVNIANHQFAHWVLPQRVAHLLEATGLPPSCLCLEITETVFMANPELAAETIGRLRAIGVSLQMDDFGTGYSSLSALRNFKLNTLKIDRSFVTGIMQNRSDRAIVRTVTVLAADLGMDVVAEGVESAQQLELLRALGCRRGQGYYFSVPLAVSEVHRYLKALSPPPEAPSAQPKTP